MTMTEEFREREIDRIYHEYGEQTDIVSLIKAYQNALKTDDAIPMPIAYGTNIFANKFYSDMGVLYIYCIQNKKTWKEALNFEYKPGVLY